MSNIRRIRAGDSVAVLRPTINQIIDAIHRLEYAPLGPGLARSPAGILRVLPTAAQQQPPATTPEVSGDPKELDLTQGMLDEDTYVRSTDKTPVKVLVVTDIRYNPTTHKLQMAYRELVATGITSVSAEPEWVDITTAIQCPVA